MAKNENSMKLKKATSRKLDAQAQESNAVRMNKLSSILSGLSSVEESPLSPDEFGDTVNDPMIGSSASKQTFKMKKPRT